MINVRRETRNVVSDPFSVGLGHNSTRTSTSRPKPRETRSPKAGHFVKIAPTRPTRKACQERLACKGPRRVAVYECVQCSSLQCEACENLIHENSRFIFHDRTRLPIPKKEHLCEHFCETKNLADIFCEQCKKQLCFACEVVLHQGKAKLHKRIPFEADDFFSLTNLNHNETYLDSGDFLSLEDNNISDNTSIPGDIDPLFSLKSHFSNSFDSKEREDKEYSLLKDDIDSFHSLKTQNMMSMQTIPDVASIANQKLSELSLSAPAVNSFLLIDDEESIRIPNEDEFTKALNCSRDTSAKVISIFGNTGEGKSHTLNHTFFNGQEVFKTSATQVSCTIGVWAVFDPKLNIILLDTEGLLGLTTNQNQRTRLLLKVLAVSDVIIYRTRAERLHNDLFTFLGDASKAYMQHFSRELKAASKRFNFDGPLSSLGPTVIIFHETVHTEILGSDLKKSPEDILKLRFKELDQTIDAFSALQYVGTRTANKTTSFNELASAIKKQLENSSIRSARSVDVIYKALRVLNEKFSGDIEKTVTNTFPDQYFTCNVVCMSCENRCTHSMNHTQDGTPHVSSNLCRFQHQHDNKILCCQACRKRGETIVVIPKTSAAAESGWFGIAKYAWAGYVLECPNCGIIYRSRQYWYGNKDPWETVVQTEFCHIWPDGGGVGQSNQNAAQRVIDSVSYLSDAVTSISAKPTKSITSWVADQIAPSYWVPNYAIKQCRQCEKEFEPLEKKHHCRSCGDGFCDECSTKTKAVPERGWGQTPVRVCDNCFEKGKPEDGQLREEAVTVRKVGEVLHSAIGTVASAIDYPLVLLKDTARPTYWVPDDQIKECTVCHNQFSFKVYLHHCRGCGQGVCDFCSQNRKAVPTRGWDYPVRVCNTCNSRTDL